MTKYESISNEIRRRVKNGYYPTDQPIPDELSLTKEFGCSRMTMKRALDILVAEGLLYRKRGHGTFIIQSAANEEKINVISEETLGLSNLLKHSKVTSRTIVFEVQFPDEKVAAQLGIDRDTPVYHIIRLRLVDDEPFVTEQTYMPVAVIPGITEEVLQASIYNQIHETLRLKIGG